MFIHQNKLKNENVLITNVLEGYSEEYVGRMSENVVEHIPKFVYATKQERLEDYKDAFDVAMEGILRRFKEIHKLYKWK